MDWKHLKFCFRFFSEDRSPTESTSKSKQPAKRSSADVAEKDAEEHQPRRFTESPAYQPMEFPTDRQLGRRLADALARHEQRLPDVPPVGYYDTAAFRSKRAWLLWLTLWVNLIYIMFLRYGNFVLFHVKKCVGFTKTKTEQKTSVNFSFWLEISMSYEA